MNRDNFMSFFRDNEKLNALSADDRVEVFQTILVGSSDLTKELINGVLADYGVIDIECVEAQKPEYIKQGVAQLNQSGGATLDFRRQCVAEFKDGYMVSLKGMELQVPYELEPDLEATIEKYIQDNIDILNEDKGLYVGLWRNEDMCYIDISKHIQDESEAIIVGIRNRQLAIFKCQPGCEILLDEYKIGWFYDKHGNVVENLQKYNYTTEDWGVIISPLLH